MNINRQRIALLVILIFVAQALMGCSMKPQTLDNFSATAGVFTPSPLGRVVIESPDPAGVSAQATIDTGQSKLLDLSRRATEVSLNIAQSANASAQSTKDFNQRQKLDLDYQATIVSLNITQAAALRGLFPSKRKLPGMLWRRLRAALLKLPSWRIG